MPGPARWSLGGGSNLVVADAGVDVPVVRVAVPGVQVRPIAADVALVTVGAGANWDDVVAELTASGYADLGPLSGIPGSAGATPVQNVGAYGTELSDVLVAVTLYDRVRAGRSGRCRPPSSGSATGPRCCAAPTEPWCWTLTLRLRRGDTRIRYAELARTLGVPIDGFAPPEEVRQAVLTLRRGKGMVLDPADPDTISAGSFFTNPILDPSAAARTADAIRDRLGRRPCTPPIRPPTVRSSSPPPG